MRRPLRVPLLLIRTLRDEPRVYLATATSAAVRHGEIHGRIPLEMLRVDDPVPGPLRTARSGRPLSSPYRVRVDVFDLTKLHLNARASQPSDNDAIPSADISNLFSLIEQFGRRLEAHDQPPSNMPYPPQPHRPRTAPAQHQHSPAAVKSPRKKKANKTSLPAFLHPSPSPQPPDLPQYKPTVDGASQAKKPCSRTNRAARCDVWMAHAEHLRDAEHPRDAELHATKREETEVKMCTQQDLILAYGLDSLDWTDITPACVLTPDDAYHCREGYEIGEVNVECCSVLEICRLPNSN
ncbi:hypothetical protein EV122DRAFT_284815 [Schizophyllum commune]